MAVGNLPPNLEVDITLTIISELQYVPNSNILRYVLPTSIAPSHILS